MTERIRTPETLTADLNTIYDQVRSWMTPKTVHQLYTIVQRTTKASGSMNPKDRLLGLYRSVSKTVQTHLQTLDPSFTHFDVVVNPAGGTDITGPSQFSDNVVSIDSANTFGYKINPDHDTMSKKNLRETMIRYLTAILTQGHHWHDQNFYMYGYAANLWLNDTTPGTIRVHEHERHTGITGDYAKVRLSFETRAGRTIHHTALTGLRLQKSFTNTAMEDQWLLRQVLSQTTDKQVLALSKAGEDYSKATRFYQYMAMAPFYAYLPAGTIVLADRLDADDLGEYKKLGGTRTDLMTDTIINNLRSVQQTYVAGTEQFGFGYTKDIRFLKLFQLNGIPSRA